MGNANVVGGKDSEGAPFRNSSITEEEEEKGRMQQQLNPHQTSMTYDSIPEQVTSAKIPAPNAGPLPLNFTPQARVPMAPLQKVDEVGLDPSPMYTYDNDLQQQPGIPALIQWSHGGNEVFVEGSWDNWSSRIPLQKAGREFAIVKMFPSGVYRYKFIISNEWRYDPDLPWAYDDDKGGPVSNILDVQDYVPENLDGISAFEVPGSPDESYNDPFPGFEESSKDPPLMPPHLLDMDAPGGGLVVLRPQHVILNHLYVETTKAARAVVALGLTHRFRSKYVTVLLYKPVQK